VQCQLDTRFESLIERANSVAGEDQNTLNKVSKIHI
jgi:hypothetical protein